MPTTYRIRIRELELALVNLDLRLARLTDAAREVCQAPQDEAALARLRALVSPSRYEIVSNLQRGANDGTR